MRDDGSAKRQLAEILERASPQPAVAETIRGSHNIIGDHNTVTIHVTTAPPTITETQMAELRGLVGQIARQGQVPHGRIWGRLCRRHQVSAGRQLPERDYPSARRFLENWLAQVEPPPRQPDG